MTSAGSPSRCGPPAEAGLLAVCRPGSRSPTPKGPGSSYRLQGLVLTRILLYPDRFLVKDARDGFRDLSRVPRLHRVQDGEMPRPAGGEAPQVRLTGLFCPVRKPWR